MNSIRRLAVAAVLLAAPAFAWAQSFPSKPITLICPWPPGGTTGAHLRKFAEVAQKYVGQPVEEICRLAKSLGVDLIVVGHNQHTSFAARWWKGSVGASLLDYSPCSILVALSRM